MTDTLKIDIPKKIYWWIGNIYRFFTLPFFQKKISFNKTSTIFGSSFNKESGWNHIIETLKEYDLNPNIHYKETSMYFYLKNFKPRSISELINSNNKNYLPIFTYPWGTFKKGEIISSKDQTLSRFCGPSSDLFIEEEFQRTILLYKKLKKEGYRPWFNFNRHIGGTFLIDKYGKRCFIVLQGNHRMAIFSHLSKYKTISVRNVKGYDRKIFEKNIINWPLVKMKKCSKEDAINIFKLFFRENGNHLLNHMNDVK